MRILNLSISHHTAAVALRERAAFGSEEWPEALAAFRDDFPNVEAALLSTCNRTQWTIARPSHAPPDAETLTAWWATRRGLTPEEISPAVDVTQQGEAVRQVFRVTAGLDARVVGEPEIHHQVKRAYDAAVTARTAGPALHHIFQQALAAAGAARHATGLSRAGGSVASAAVSAIQTHAAPLDQRRVVCLGAGTIATATLRGLIKAGATRITLANRTPSRANALANELGLVGPNLVTCRPEHLSEVLRTADIFITAAEADRPIVDATTIQNARIDDQRKLLIVDLAVPRNVSPQAASIPDVTLLNIDTLADTIKHDPARAAAIALCEERIASDAAACLTRVRNREIGQLIRQLRSRLHNIADDERHRSQSKLAAFARDSQQAEQFEKLLAEHNQRLINKVLHLPLQQFDARRDDVALGFYAAALRRLFDLDNSSDQDATEAGHAARGGER
ncbi:MAG: glutamyl-tRNA reductase [Planctomycetota bacterium]